MTQVAKAYPAVDFLPRANRTAASRKERSFTDAPTKGVFLVASDSLNDPNFSQTVVLLLEYDKSGAIGLVINRPSEVSLASLLPEVEGLKDRKELVFIGGPVGGGQLFLLVRSTNRPRQSEEIVDGVYASASLQTLREIIAEESAVSAFQAYAGYAGWGPGQLDAELLRGDWLVTPADSETLFDKAPDAIWPELIRQNKGLWVYRQADALFPFRLVSKGQGVGEDPTVDALER
ncbi:MAG: YqgE/AlgH family protein [Gammaproteobacteria bacterium]|nr:YqgE/AlgH family protein [Gammaproteobacteria bacterium]MDH3412695.1 YqgE/AlgH family protein [Gammaproteobacteria bacterium]